MRLPASLVSIQVTTGRLECVGESNADHLTHRLPRLYYLSTSLSALYRRPLKFPREEREFRMQALGTVLLQLFLAIHSDLILCQIQWRSAVQTTYPMSTDFRPFCSHSYSETHARKIVRQV